MSKILATVAVAAAIIVGTGTVAVAAQPAGRRDIVTHVHPDGRRDGKPGGGHGRKA
jgi:hypothetical protein